MNKLKKILSLTLSVFLLLFCTGCWNYRELEMAAIVAGLSIDRDFDTGEYIVNVEVVNLKPGGKETTVESFIYQGKGKTIFDACRNIISITGNKLYFAHTKIVIISKAIAEEGMEPVLDWLMRDHEIREDIVVIVSKQERAMDIWKAKRTSNPIISFTIEDILSGQNDLSKTPNVELYELIGAIYSPSQAPYLPAICMEQYEGDMIIKLCGTAVFDKDRLVGFLSEEDTMNLYFVWDEIKGGILTIKEPGEGQPENIALEIRSSKTTIRPKYENQKISMDIQIKTQTILGENGGSVNYVNMPGRAKLITDMEKALEKDILSTIKKVQQNFGTDILNFGTILKGDMPHVWKSVEHDWKNIFKQLDVNVSVKIDIAGSQLISKPERKN